MRFNPIRCNHVCIVVFGGHIARFSWARFSKCLITPKDSITNLHDLLCTFEIGDELQHISISITTKANLFAIVLNRLEFWYCCNILTIVGTRRYAVRLSEVPISTKVIEAMNMAINGIIFSISFPFHWIRLQCTDCECVRTNTNTHTLSTHAPHFILRCWSCFPSLSVRVCVCPFEWFHNSFDFAHNFYWDLFEQWSLFLPQRNKTKIANKVTANLCTSTCDNAADPLNLWRNNANEIPETKTLYK